MKTLTDAEIEKLKPCPCCGHVTAPRISASMGFEEIPAEWDAWVVRCDASPDIGGCGMQSGGYDSEAEAAEAWNRRSESSPHVVAEPVANRWYLGSLNDGLFIINRCPTPNATDFPPHDDYGPDVVLNVVALTEKQAQEIVDAHNATLDAPQQTAPVTEAKSLSVAPGWKLVPIDPTVEMLEKVSEYSVGYGEGCCPAPIMEKWETIEIYTAMLNAAPKPTTQEPTPRAESGEARCTTCDDTGVVHRADGEFLGDCTLCSPDKVSHEQAMQSAQRFIAHFFETSGEKPKVRIPADPTRDDDLILTRYIRQQSTQSSAIDESVEPSPPAAEPPLNTQDGVDELTAKIAEAYGYLWHVNNDPIAPIMQYSPEKASYEARKILRDTLTSKQRGEAINKIGRLIGRYADDHPWCGDDPNPEHRSNPSKNTEKKG